MTRKKNDKLIMAQGLVKKGLKSHNAGTLAEAQEYYLKALEMSSNEPDANHYLGVTFHQLEKHAEALKYLEKATKLKPDSSQVFNHYGCALLASRQLVEAEKALRDSIKLNASNSDALFNLGSLMVSEELLKINLSENEQEERAAEAVNFLNQAVTQQPEQLNWKMKLAGALIDAGNPKIATKVLDHVIAMQGDLPEAYFLRSRIEKSVAAHLNLRKSLILKPDAKATINNFAFWNLVENNIKKVLAWYRRGLTVDPNDSAIRWGLAQGFLLNGFLKEGWTAAKWRHFKPELYINRKGLPPEWDGNSVRDGCLFIFQEQGIGDELRFSSCFKDLAKKADAPCIVETDARLISLFSRSFPKLKFIDKLPRNPGPPVNVDFSEIKEEFNLTAHCPLADLPLHLRPALDDFPVTNSYLVADPNQCQLWRERLDRLGPEPKIGFCWQTALPSKNYEDYFFKLEELAPIFSLKNYQFVNLQYTECEVELQTIEKKIGINIYRPTKIDMFNELDAVAALIKELDVVIGPMTSVISMAGALGTRCYGVNLHRDWTCLGTDRQPWTPSMTCFYRGHSPYWAPIIERITETLVREFGSFRV